MNTRSRQIATLLILGGETDCRHGHQQAVHAGGIGAHQAGQFATTDSPIAGYQILQAANTVDKALIRLRRHGGTPFF